MEYLRTADDAAKLTDRLGAGRRDGAVVVVVSIARVTGRSYVDELRLEAAVGERADLYVVSPDVSRLLRTAVPALRHVFGGAAQAFAPVGPGRPLASRPLRVAFGPADVDRMTEELIADVRALTAGPAAPADD
ncbi:hypothetical protein [Ruania zhangjianzhongii]|uniref:hypothetical protein n=1 Tax=Ruania zhangjianzhongii TaxID=2603206 RepID=UPI0011C870E7|nr:hypothetical protein [Ruania zhangjianzhongii]